MGDVWNKVNYIINIRNSKLFWGRNTMFLVKNWFLNKIVIEEEFIEGIVVVLMSSRVVIVALMSSRVNIVARDLK